MAEETQTVIIDVKTTADRAAEKIVLLTADIAEQKKALDELRNAELQDDKARADNAKAIERQSAKIKGLQNELRAERKTLENAVKANEDKTKSIKSMRTELSALTRAYDSLSEAERNSASGQQLKDKINELTTAIKGGEEETQRFYRNVGNYEQAMKSALASTNPFVGVLVNLQSQAQAAGGVLPAIKNGIAGATQAAKAFIATPIGAAIAAITVVIKAVSAGIKSSEENTNKWREITAKFQPLLDVFTKVLQGAASVVLTIADAYLSAYTAVLQFFGLIDKESGGEVERYNKLAKAQADYAKQSRENLVQNAKDESEAAELRNKAVDKDKYTAEERVKFLEEAAQKEKDIAERNKAEAEEKLRLLQEEAKATGNTAEMNDKLAQAEAEVYRATTEYNQKTRRIISQLNTAKNEIANEDKQRMAEEKQRLQELAQARKEAADKEVESLQSLRDARISLMADGEEKEIAQENNRAAQAIAALEKRLKEEKNLTVKARATIARQIETEYEIHQQNLTAIAANYAAQRNADTENAMQEISSILQKTTEEQVEEVIKTYEAAYAKIEEMRSNMTPPERAGFATDEEFEEALERYQTFMLNLAVIEERLQTQQADAVGKIRKDAQDKLDKDEADRIAAAAAERKTELDHDLLVAGDSARAQYDAKMKYLNAELEANKGNADAQMRIQNEMAQAKQELLDKQMAAVQQYADGVLNAMSAVNDALNAQDEARLQKIEEDYEQEKEALQAKLDSGLISQEEYEAEQERLAEELAAKQKEIEIQQAKREKALAIFSILIQTAAAITEALPNIPLSILAGVMGAAQLAAVAAQPLPKAARGMYIKGKRHSEGGELIEAEDGEVIMNRRSVQMFWPELSAMNVAGGGVPFQVQDGGFATRHAANVVRQSSTGTDIEGVIQQTAQAVRISIAETVGNTLRDVKIYTAVEDIRRGERQYSEIDKALTL